ncbi:TniQ family protein [Crenobacter cavernae]|uniref:TniQ family protein n=1 Tax=Crenobacter cavernae TaxID=2290923 RepID=UPI0015F127E6|nr:TniQ family protein [Crenobacter cavernae]
MAGLPEGRLPLHLKPRDDELLSSWLVRLAHAHQLKVESLCTMLFGQGSPIWNRDIDRLAPDGVLARLSLATGAPVEQTRRTTLVDLEGWLSETIASHGHSHWIVPLGVFHRNRRHPGLMYCPACLTEESDRYYRRLWRIAWASVCVKHRCELVDRCPSCGAPVAPHRTDMKARCLIPTPVTLIRCHACQGWLTQQPLAPASAALVAFQSRLEQALAQGYIDWDDNPSLHSVLFFEGLRALLSNGLRGLNRMVPGTARRAVFETRSLEDRRADLLQLCEWLEHWPQHFLDTIATKRLRGAELCSATRPLPYWYFRVVHPLAHLSAPTLEPEAEAIMSVITKHTGTHNLRAARRLAGKDITTAWRHTHVRRRPSLDDYELAVVTVDHHIAATLEPSQRLTLLRQKFMLVARYGLRLSGVALAQLTLADVRARVPNMPPVSFYDVPHTPSQAAAWLLWYCRHVRPQLHPAADEPRLFVNARTGKGLGANACRQWTTIPPHRS